jgi:alpha-beta hydrolase superfamily lysophospholipase
MTMKHTDLAWRAKDGLNLYAQVWEPQESPQAVVCLVHGLGEHGGRYAHIAEALTRSGFVLLAADLRGHGKSEGPRGHSPSSQAFIEDIDRLLVEASQRYPGLPRFLYGHSLGGLLVLFYVLKRVPQLAGVVATAPSLRTPLREQTLKVALAQTMASILPTFSMPTGLQPSQLSHDPAIEQAYIKDPLVHDRATFAMASTTFKALDWTMEHASEFSLPLLLMQGSADQIVYPRGAQEFAARVKGDCTLKMWEGLAHEIHNEPEKEQVLAYMVTWLESKLPSGPLMNTP